MRCPMCGEDFNPLDAMMDAEWREIMVDVIPTFSGHGKITFEYVENFGTNPIRMKGKKILRLLKELSKLVTSGRFTYKKKTYVISQRGVLEAFGIVNNRHFESPLQNHNYLKSVMIGIAEKELKGVRDEQDRALRKREAARGHVETRHALSVSVQDNECISIGEFARQGNVDVATLAANVGRKME